MISQLLTTWLAAMEAQRVDGSALESYLSGRVGHEQPIETKLMPAYSLDFVREVQPEDTRQGNALSSCTLLLSARLYTVSIEKAGALPAHLARDLYWRQDDAGAQFGLRPAIRKIPRLRVGEKVFLLSMTGDARPLSKSQFPEGRWSSAMEVLCTARAVVSSF